MSESSSEEGRSEAPTPYKLKRARERGSVARGMDLAFASGLAAGVVTLWMLGPGLASDMALMMRRSVVAAGEAAGGAALLTVSGQAMASVVRPIALTIAALFGVVLVFELVQTGVVFSAHPLKPDFSRLDPAKGLKRIFTVRMLIETAKTIAKFVVYSIIVILVVRDAWREAMAIGTAADLAQALAAATVRLALLFLGAAIAFALLDQLIARRQFLKQMRMSRRDVRRESKDREGDPRVKQRRRQLHGRFVEMSQSLRNVRSADILVTNPVHFAVALRYAPAEMEAPKVVGRGSHAFALRMKRLAFLYGVTVVEEPELARALFRRCALDREIPDLFFAPVAVLYRRLRRTREAATAVRADA
jgi:flagellar biosynthetic protein FlhB